MTTGQTAQQLELAAQILRTGHPWECKFSTNGFEKPVVSLITAICGEKEVRPVLATPPDGRPLHNPDNLTAEQVGVGYRLFLPEEADGRHEGKCQVWNGRGQWATYAEGNHMTFSYRLPLSVPWPPAPVDPYAELKAAHAAGKVIEVFVKDDEYGPDRWSKKESDGWTLPPERYRIKPEPPPFQLPPPPPGMSWHRADGWKAGDLPQRYRPLVKGEPVKDGDEVFSRSANQWLKSGNQSHGMAPERLYRTTRPLTFEHAGKTWTWHKVGDPMPCDGGSLIWVLYDNGTHSLNSYCANDYVWGRVIGWCYAKPATKEVELGPEDVPPGSVIQLLNRADSDELAVGFHAVICVCRSHIVTLNEWGNNIRVDWRQLKDWLINRSLSKGQWNPDAWEPCSKTIPA